jgi:hypothetical protein
MEQYTVEQPGNNGTTSTYYGDVINAEDGYGVGRRVRVLVETATPAPGQVFLDLDTETDEDKEIITREINESGVSDHQPEDGIGWFPVALTAEEARLLGESLIKGSEEAVLATT